MSKSIMQQEECCFICGSQSWLEEHHVFGGPNRKLSEKYGIKVYLCHFCHNEPPNGVHHNEEKMTWLKQQGQQAFEAKYGHEKYMQVFGRNWL